MVCRCRLPGRPFFFAVVGPAFCLPTVAGSRPLIRRQVTTNSITQKESGLPNSEDRRGSRSVNQGAIRGDVVDVPQVKLLEAGVDFSAVTYNDPNDAIGMNNGLCSIGEVVGGKAIDATAVGIVVVVRKAELKQFEKRAPQGIECFARARQAQCFAALDAL